MASKSVEELALLGAQIAAEHSDPDDKRMQKRVAKALYEKMVEAFDKHMTERMKKPHG